MKDFMRVLSYAGDKRPLMTRAVILLTVSVLFSVVPFFLVGLAVNSFLGETPPELPWLLGIAAGVLVCLAIKNFLNGAGLDASHKLAYHTLAGMRRRVADKMLKISMGDIQAYGAGPAKKNFVENIEEMELILAHAIPEGIANLLTFAVVIVTMFAVDWRMALAGVASIFLGFIPTMLMMVDGYKRMNAWYAANEVMNRRIIEYISGMEVIKVFGQQSRSFKKYSESVDNYRDETLAWYKAAFVHMTSYTVLFTTALLVMLPAGIWLYHGGSISMFKLVLSLLLGMSVGVPAMRLLNFIPQFPQLKYKSAKIEGMFEIPDMPQGAGPAPERHDVAFENVTFAYHDTDVIRDLTLALPENSVTALVGESGAGKSTLAKLIMRFWDVKSGAVKIGGVDLRAIFPDALMESISYVSQDNFLFNTSIMENIRYGKPSAADAEVIGMARAAQCHEFIMETENGYDTVVGSSGDKLSGGEKQRICIARAMLKDAPIIILDEATSFADPENEDKIQDALSRLVAGKTVIIVAHRLSSIVDADNIVLLENGRIADQGRHNDLLGRSALYRKLWEAHVESMNWDLGGGAANA
ncbi:MAG: ABC transporter ATP-binding protein/permease [Oscillospiraceae bacterium]|jgi:ATP-binding cassette subfamily B protein|nr:ABC transporter ATP-binding protein/permease [Oscillospiraceae bacterium]